MHIAIIGNGISGVTAARYLRKKTNDRITLISSESDHFFSRTALMYIYMGHMKYEHTKPYEDWFWEKNKLGLIRNEVISIDFENKKLKFKNSESLSYDKLILATGSKPNKFGWKGQNLNGVQGLYSYQDLEKLEEITPKIKTGVIVGGGLIGIELAEMLKSRGKNVIFLVRENSFWDNILPEAESKMINNHIKKHHIDLRLNTEFEEIIDDGNGNVKEIKIKNGEILPCEFVGLTVGVSPNIEFLKNTKLDTDIGILVDKYFQTNITDVFAIGDCVQHREPPAGRRNLEQIWYTGKIMGQTIAEILTGNKTSYNPGNFFNSAKFLDIEYQTYGQVPANPPENINSIFWKHQIEDKLVRINFEITSLKVTGVNTFGIRMRHDVWDKWLSEELTINQVLNSLTRANFDPEFFKKHETEIVEELRSQIS